MDLCEEWDDIQEAQMSHWLKHPSVPATFYKEPILEERTVEAIKLVCNILQQTDEVFIASVDVVEEYVRAKIIQNADIHNSLLTIACAILMTSKLIGSHPEIKITSIQDLMIKLAKEDVGRNRVKQTELDIFATLGKLALTTMATDLNMFLEYYIKSLKLCIDIQSVCLEILNTVYIAKKRMFAQLKSIYSQSVEAFQVFKHLVCNKIYFPAGIVLCALRISNFNRFLNLKQIAQDIGKITSIHHDHLRLLAGIIYELIEEKFT